MGAGADSRIQDHVAATIARGVRQQLQANPDSRPFVLVLVNLNYSSGLPRTASLRYYFLNLRKL